MDLIKPIEFIDQSKFIEVDAWDPKKEDNIFRHTKGAIILDKVSEFYGLPHGDIDCFILSSKRSFNSPKLRDHCCHYLNYFEKFYDTDRELLTVYFRIKYLIDYEPGYTKEAFFNDINRYILNSNIFYKVVCMNTENYHLNLTYRNNRNPGLQYND